MSDFKFNFETSDDEDKSANENGQNAGESHISCGPDAIEVPWKPTQLQPILQDAAVIQHEFGSHTLCTVPTAEVERYLLQKKSDSCGLVKAIAEHSDLVAGQYEGGLKVWECSVDLCLYLQDCELPVKGSRILELGCGAGLPGMVASKMGAVSVHFQDFNQEVLETYTMNNLDLNSIKSSSCQFFAGDWASFVPLALDQNLSYDLILTAETVYNVNSYPKLLKVFSSLLDKEGVVLVAAKNDYFGVGGSVSSFVQFVQDSKQFQVETVKQIDAGLPRKILKLTRT